MEYIFWVYQIRLIFAKKGPGLIKFFEMEEWGGDKNWANFTK